MLTTWEALKLALRHRDTLSKLIDFRYDANLPWRGAVSENECVLLKEMIESANKLPGPVIEVGTLFGFTTNHMASWLIPEKTLITIDNYSWNPWGIMPEVHRAVTRRVLAPFCGRKEGGIQIVDMGKDQFYAEYTGAVPAFVFIDAIHTYEEVKKDIAWAKKLGVPLIGGHDFSPKFEGVMRAVTESLGDAIQTRESVWIWGMRK